VVHDYITASRAKDEETQRSWLQRDQLSFQGTDVIVLTMALTGHVLQRIWTDGTSPLLFSITNTSRGSFQGAIIDAGRDVSACDRRPFAREKNPLLAGADSFSEAVTACLLGMQPIRPTEK
jgi:hypothetical protein